MDRMIKVDRYEVARAADGDVMLCFMGNVSVEDGAEARIAGADLSVLRGDFPPLVFLQLDEIDLERIRLAPMLYIRRTAPDGKTSDRVAVSLVG